MMSLMPFSKVAYLYPDVAKERVYVPSPNDHDCFWVNLGYEDIHGK